VSEEQRDPIVIEQSKTKVNVLWGFLTIAFAVVLWRGHEGAQTDLGRLAGDILFGAAVVVSVAAWISSHRHPARLEVSQDVISLWHRGKPNSVELRRTGDLYVYWRINPRGGAQSYLKVSGSDDAIPLVYFNWKNVESACRAAGWPIRPPARLRMMHRFKRPR
jgi:hypothetical protein